MLKNSKTTAQIRHEERQEKYGSPKSYKRGKLISFLYYLGDEDSSSYPDTDQDSDCDDQEIYNWKQPK